MSLFVGRLGLGNKIRMPSGEYLHIIKLTFEGKVEARVNGSTFNTVGMIENFLKMVNEKKGEIISDEAYQKGVESFWAKRDDSSAMRVEWFHGVNA